MRRLAAYAWLACEDYDRRLNAERGYTPRRDEVHPGDFAASTRYAGAVWRAVASVAVWHSVPIPDVRRVHGRLRSYDDARPAYAPAGGRHLPDRLDRDLGRAVEVHVRAASERRFLR